MPEGELRMNRMTRRAFLRSAAAASLLPSVEASGIPYGLGDKRESKALLDYFAGIAPELLRPAEGYLKHPSISPSLPGKEYSTELWDWDTYWTTRGLFRLAELTGDSKLEAQTIDHAKGSLQNFLDYQAPDGRVPIMVSVKNNDLFGSAKSSNPGTHNQAKPVLGQLALLIAGHVPDLDWLESDFGRLIHFWEAWAAGNRSSIGLLVWGDDVAIGDDNDPTTFGRPPFSSANLLLNCLYYRDLQAGAELAKRLKRAEQQEQLSAMATQLGAVIQKYCWDPRDSFYYTVDVQCVDRRAELIPTVKRGMDMSWRALPLRIQMFTGFLPLWCGLASQSQGNALVEVNYLADDRFRANWGVRSLSSRETMYSLAFSSNPSNWLGPIWIVVNYFVWKGLQEYGFTSEAAELASKTTRLLANDLAKSQSLNEYYDPDSRAPLSYRGFVDWNMLVLEML
jgi:putative isomerase